MSGRHVEELRRARKLLESPGLAVQLMHVLGRPVEKGLDLLPPRSSRIITDSTRKALEAAVSLAARSLRGNARARPADRLHKVLAGGTGAAGGAFGFVALPVELPISTALMLRSIADIARCEGEPIDSIESRLACIEVFALGGRTARDDAAETGYFAVRAALAGAITAAGRHLARHGMSQAGAPALVRLIHQVASRFGIVVAEKMAAQAIPAVGAAGGAVVNVLFMDHFQNMARGHFTVRRLERLYTPQVVRAQYDQL